MQGRSLLFGLLLSAIGSGAYAESDTVDVRLVIELTRSLTLDVEGPLSATRPRLVSFADETVDGLTGIVTGCLFMRGVDQVDITASGSNPYDGDGVSGVGPFLSGSGAAAGNFLYYEPVIAVGLPDTDFPAGLWQAHAQPGSGGSILSVSGRTDVAPLERANRITASARLFAASGGRQSDEACSSGPNFAVGALVFLEQAMRSELPASAEGAGYFGSVDRLTEVSGLAEGQYRFADTLTITMVPRFD